MDGVFQNFPEAGANPEGGMPTYNLGKFVLKTTVTMKTIGQWGACVPNNTSPIRQWMATCTEKDKALNMINLHKLKRNEDTRYLTKRYASLKRFDH